MTRTFHSDNYSGAHPEVLAALVEANSGHASAYGADEWTARLHAAFAPHFGDQVSVWPVFNGTGANVVSLMSMTTRWAAAICTTQAHINVDECGAPEKVGGVKLLAIPTEDAKLTPELIDREAWGMDDEHRAQAQVVSLTQSTELGTTYTPAEVAAICTHAHDLGLKVHMDGARLANAAAHLGVPLRAFTTDAGVDVVSFGGTKNGMVYGEAVLVLNPDAVVALPHTRKHAMQLSSKMRFISAQLAALMSDDLWLRSAAHANAMAQRLARGLADLPGVELLASVQANGVFATVPPDVLSPLQDEFGFYVWDAARSAVRLMCSFDTTPHDVDALIGAFRSALTRG